MKSLIQRFSFEAIKFNNQIGAALVLVWLIILACTISSILSQPYSRQHRIFWIAIVACLPAIGLLAYLPFSIRRENLPHFFVAKRRKERRRASGRSGGDTASMES